jgi:hypothetical protein
MSTWLLMGLAQRLRRHSKPAQERAFHGPGADRVHSQAALDEIGRERLARLTTFVAP